MKTIRQDAWTEEDDRVLAEIILRHISEGSTQLIAFEECAEKLGRTEAACGYRWNACVRKKYKAGIDIAKAQRKEIKGKQKRGIRDSVYSFTKEDPRADFAWNEVLRFLKEQKQEHSLLVTRLRQFEKELEQKEKELQDMKSKKERFEADHRRLHTAYESVKEDYKTLVSIMERARKLTLLSDMAEPEISPRFRMDANGNLDRIE